MTTSANANKHLQALGPPSCRLWIRLCRQAQAKGEPEFVVVMSKLARESGVISGEGVAVSVRCEQPCGAWSRLNTSQRFRSESGAVASICSRPSISADPSNAPHSVESPTTHLPFEQSPIGLWTAVLAQELRRIADLSTEGTLLHAWLVQVDDVCRNTDPCPRIGQHGTFIIDDATFASRHAR